MDTKYPSKRERELLLLIQRYSSEYSRPPTTDVLADIFMREVLWQVDFDETVQTPAEMRAESRRAHKNILNIIGRLEKKNLVYRTGSSVNLTSNVEEYFSRLLETVDISSNVGLISAQIPVRGYVKAGPGDDLDIELVFEALESLSVPNVRKGHKVYALRVDGLSMESEGIHHGDYVIVEEYFEGEGPRENDIVVAKYIELDRRARDNSEMESEDWELIGHTLKRFKEEIKGAEKFARLSRLQSPDSNPFLIRAARVAFVGRVAGLYRTYPK